MKKILCFMMSILLAFPLSVLADGESNQVNIDISAPSAILLDFSGNIIFEKNAHEQREPASVTKIMTMLLAMESIESGKITLDDMVTVSQEAASQGGTQVYLEANEQISVNDLLKSIATSSANDAAVALGEHISGTHASFVELMNQRATELGMNDTTFKNATGLTSEGHVTSAYDISLMSIELLKHELIFDYTTIWMDSIRDGEFELANTNKLLNTYNGLNGLKTGYTSEAMFCMAATATRDGESFLAVVMGAETSTLRNTDASLMLDYAFANYKTFTPSIDGLPDTVLVAGGKVSEVDIKVNGQLESMLISKTSVIEEKVSFNENIIAPIVSGQKLGEFEIIIDNSENYILDIVAKSDVKKVDFITILVQFIQYFFMNT